MNKLTKWIVGAICALALFTSTFAADTNTVATAKTAPAPTVQAENWVLTLGGVGSTLTGNDTTSAFGVDLSLGYRSQWLFPTETGIRQSVGYNDDDWTFNTRIYNDWTLVSLFNKKVELFGGGAVGLQYGNQKPSWEIAPEAGIRLWMKKDVAIIGRAEVPWDLAEWEFKDTVRYFLGFQVKF